MTYVWNMRKQCFMEHYTVCIIQNITIYPTRVYEKFLLFC